MIIRYKYNDIIRYLLQGYDVRVVVIGLKIIVCINRHMYKEVHHMCVNIEIVELHFD